MAETVLTEVTKENSETFLSDFNRLALFDEEACNVIFEFSNDRLQRMAVMEIARLKGFLLGTDPWPDGKELA